jgi:TolC family type I secretion outer membrane protein
MKRLFLLAAAGIGVPGAAQADTLHDALASAYRNNPTLQAAREGAEAADENTYQALATFLPQISVNGTFGKNDTDTQFPFSSTPREEHLDPQSVSVEAVQSVFSGGRRIGQLRMARAQSRAAHEDQRGAEQEVLLRAVTAYVDVRHAEEVLRILRENVELLDNQVAGARLRFQEGDVTRTDIAQAEARRAAALGDQASGTASLESARAVYTQLIGRAPEELEAPPDPPDLPDNIETAIEEALSRNPDLRQSQYAARVARAQISIERSTLLPQISIVARASGDRDINGRGVRTEGSSLAAQFSVPLFEGGFGFSRIRQSSHTYRRARAQSEEVRRFVVASVTAAWNDRLAALQTVETARTQLNAATFALDGVQQEQLEGQRTTIDVLNAHQEFLAAQLAVVRAERDAYVAAHRLLQAIGGLDPDALGFESDYDD